MSANRSRLYVPALAPLYAACDMYALTALRIVLGLLLIPHGCQKAFGWFDGLGFAKFSQIFESIGYKPGALWVSIIILVEIGGGICLVLGFITRPSALLVALFMINAIWVTSAKGFFWTAGGMEYSILILAVALVFFIRGGGNYSLDGKMAREF